MPALRFLALLTLGFCCLVAFLVLNAQLVRNEAEARRVLRGEDVALEAGARTSWRLDLDGATEDERWPAAQRQPYLRLALPEDAGDVVARARARYVEAPTGESGRAAFVGATDGEGWRAGAREGDELRFGPLWLSYLHPLEVEVVVEAGEGGSAVPVLSGTVHPDYAIARRLDRGIFWLLAGGGAAAFAALVVFASVERRERELSAGRRPSSVVGDA